MCHSDFEFYPQSPKIETALQLVGNRHVSCKQCFHLLSFRNVNKTCHLAADLLLMATDSNLIIVWNASNVAVVSRQPKVSITHTHTHRTCSCNPGACWEITRKLLGTNLSDIT